MKLGIGTTSLTEKLTVNGNIALQALGYIYIGSQYLYGDNNSALYFTSNNSSYSQLILRDSDNTTYGHLYGQNNGAEFGLLDGDGNWSLLNVKDQYTALAVNNSVKLRIFSG